jgi:transcriptional regulator with XRE-family HTH domain
MPRGKLLTDKQVETVRATIQRLVENHGSQQAVAALVGVSQQTISHILKGGRPGPEALRGVARALRQGNAPLARGGRTSSFPNRDLAVAFARADGVPEPTLAAVMQASPQVDFSPGEWFDAIRLQEKMRKMGLLTPSPLLEPYEALRGFEKANVRLSDADRNALASQIVAALAVNIGLDRLQLAETMELLADDEELGDGADDAKDQPGGDRDGKP